MRVLLSLLAAATLTACATTQAPIESPPDATTFQALYREAPDVVEERLQARGCHTRADYEGALICPSRNERGEKLEVYVTIGGPGFRHSSSALASVRVERGDRWVPIVIGDSGSAGLRSAIERLLIDNQAVVDANYYRDEGLLQ